MLCRVLLRRRICIEQKVSTFSKAKETQYFQGFFLIINSMLYIFGTTLNKFKEDFLKKVGKRTTLKEIKTCQKKKQQREFIN